MPVGWHVYRQEKFSSLFVKLVYSVWCGNWFRQLCNEALKSLVAVTRDFGNDRDRETWLAILCPCHRRTNREFNRCLAVESGLCIWQHSCTITPWFFSARNVCMFVPSLGDNERLRRVVCIRIGLPRQLAELEVGGEPPDLGFPNLQISRIPTDTPRFRYSALYQKCPHLW